MHILLINLKIFYNILNKFSIIRYGDMNVDFLRIKLITSKASTANAYNFIIKQNWITAIALKVVLHV
jgi:hypothetical protein